MNAKIHNPALETAAATVRAVCTPYPQISSGKLDVVSEIIETRLTDEQVGSIREIVRNASAVCESPMSIEDACKLLGNKRDENGEIIPITRQALHYHIRRGHIRRCSIPGAARGRGVVAADVRAIVSGEAHDAYGERPATEKAAASKARHAGAKAKAKGGSRD